MPKTDIYSIEALGKSLAVLDAFATHEKPRRSVQELSKQTRLSKNTVFRILSTLSEHGYVEKRNTEFELGARLLHLNNTKLRRKDLLGVAEGYLNSLRVQFGESVNLGILDGCQIRCVDVRESPARVRLAERIGASDFLHCTMLGKAHPAFFPVDESERLLNESGIPRLTQHTITTARAMQAELARIRKSGCAVDREESMDGAFCAGVPVLDSRGLPPAAISISGPPVRFNDSTLPAVTKALLEAASGMRTALGHL